MIDQKFKDRNTVRLTGQHPKLIEKMETVLEVMDLLGYPMIVTDGIRTADQQNLLFQQGRTRPGKIVTWRDGVTVKSNHQVWADGFGHAVDCCFIMDLDGDGATDDPTWDDDRPWSLFGAIVQSQGLGWGGAWKSNKDKPHVELQRAGRF